MELIVARDGQRESNKSENGERKREGVRIQWQLREIIIKNEKNEYFIEISCKIDKLMWVFCKNDDVKQKKQVLSVKQTKSYAQADIVALMCF